MRLFLVFLLALFGVSSVMHGASADTKSSATTYKIGNPYAINGVYYYPRENFRYSETGVSSWYGPGFHNKQTANGETFNENDLTAAHRTLPLPSLVKVTNLENGHALTLVVNDRGPFVNTKNRIIDVSRRAAEILGFKEQGTARVKVEILAKESMALRGMAVKHKHKDSNDYPDYQTASRTVGSYGSDLSYNTLNPSAGRNGSRYSSSSRSYQKSSSISAYAPPRLGTFVQVGAYTKYENARKAGNIVFDAFDKKVIPQVTPIQLNGKQCFRVRVGPFNGVEHAQKALKHLKGKGMDGARIVRVE
ncbi:MAG: septal ring lytic transglycosylase RlpA family protein [Alphaproteobacteria bacterium]|nr:septal ring lytic transglycosylase RlpA family protein [Alphaproteobacteria bacterium]